MQRTQRVDRVVAQCVSNAKRHSQIAESRLPAAQTAIPRATSSDSAPIRASASM
jgi:hypothetical protein